MTNSSELKRGAKYYRWYKTGLLILTVPLFWYMMQFAVLGLATYDAENPCLDNDCRVMKSVLWNVQGIIPFVGIGWMVIVFKEAMQVFGMLGKKGKQV